VNEPGQAPTILTRDFALLNQYGLHAKPAAMFVKIASRYDADVVVEKDGTKVSGKSILGLMTLEASFGSKIRLTVSGSDAERALEELEQLIQRKFDED
jgi:phosphocarrier protein HPr